MDKNGLKFVLVQYLLYNEAFICCLQMQDFNIASPMSK